MPGHGSVGFLHGSATGGLYVRKGVTMIDVSTLGKIELTAGCD